MNKGRWNHRSFVVVVALVIAVLVPLSGLFRQHPVRAEGVLGDMRRPLVKIVGWIRELAPDHLVLGDHVLCLDPASAAAEGARLGMYAAARAQVDGQGQLQAKDVVVLSLPEQWEALPFSGQGVDDISVRRFVPAQPPEEPSGSPIEFRGLIEEIDPRYWMVDKHMVLITDRTSIKGQPQVGALAGVKGMLLFENIVLASTIQVTAPGAHAEVEFEGVIESISDDTWVVNGTTVRISAVTVIQGTPAVGAIAEVRGVLQPDDSVLAQQIIVTYPGFPFLAEVEGLVESIEETHWVVGGTTVLIDSNTFIDDSRAPAEVGMWALAQGLPKQGGALLAVRIRLSRPD